jgi:hypothetical protein
METATCERICAACQKTYVLVGRRRASAAATPAVEVVSCPYCKDARRGMLTPDVEGPVFAVYTEEAWAAVQQAEGAHLTEEDLETLEALAESNGSAPSLGRLIAEVRRLNAENGQLRFDNERMLERLRKQV